MSGILPQVVICSLSSHKVMNVDSVLLSYSVHAVFGLYKSLAKQQLLVKCQIKHFKIVISYVNLSDTQL